MAPDTGSTTLAYDARDNLTGHTDPISVTTQFTYNGFGEVIQEVSPDRGTNTYWYDAAGTLTQSTDGRGQVIAYTRDWLGRVLTKTPQSRPSSEVVAYTRDGGGLSSSYAIGQLAKVVDGSGTTLFQYDHRGNLLEFLSASLIAARRYRYQATERFGDGAGFRRLRTSIRPQSLQCDSGRRHQAREITSPGRKPFDTIRIALHARPAATLLLSR